jgi:DNA-binding MarR family transcriptional regulator
MVMTRGFLEILQMADGGLKSFNDFTKVLIKKRKLSSATISKRLDELITLKVIEEMPTKSKTGRRVIAYSTTEKGKKVIELGKELLNAVAISKTK